MEINLDMAAKKTVKKTIKTKKKKAKKPLKTKKDIGKKAKIEKKTGKKAQLKFYNTMTRRKQIFHSTGKEVKLYTCGPTVYNYAHIGNLRAYIFEDLLRRVLEFNGFRVKHVMNITDVGHLVSDSDEGEDKMEIGAHREKKTAWEIADEYTNAFMEDARKLRLLEPHIIPRATQHIVEMAALVNKLNMKGYTYLVNDGIYFDTSRFPAYGKLARLKVKELKAGARIALSEDKKNITDFAVWKVSPSDKKRNMEWNITFAFPASQEDGIKSVAEKNPNISIVSSGKDVKIKIKGFPGWHLECSAMAMKYLGETIDIHCGGVDHIAVHHTNEIAQSETATGKKFSNFWLHNEHLLVEGKKMAKSLGNYYTLRDLEKKGLKPAAFRYLCLASHYRSQMNFTFDAIRDAQNTLNGINDFMFRVKNLAVSGKENKKIINAVEIARNNFRKHINDDLNTPLALSVIFELMKMVNREIDDGKADKASLKKVEDFMFEINMILDIIEEKKVVLTQQERKLIEMREKYRREKDYKTADEIRRQLRERGIILEDTPQGVRWKRV